MPMTSLRRAVLAALLTLSPGPAVAQAETICQIARVTGGAVTVRRGATRVPAVVGLVLATGDLIRTGPESRTDVLCDSGLTVTVGPDTRIALQALLVPAPRGAALRLLDGIAGFLLPRPRPGGVEVRTSSAVAAVRSTEWAVAVERGATAVFLREGAVAVAGQGGAGQGGASVDLGPGQGVDVTARGAVGPVVAWDAARVAALDARLGLDWQARAR